MDSRLVRAVELARHKRFEPALTLLNSLLEETPTETSARFLRAKVLLRLGQTGPALKDGERVMAEKPQTKGIREFLERARSGNSSDEVVILRGSGKAPPDQQPATQAAVDPAAAESAAPAAAVPADAVATADFSRSRETLDTLAVPGFTTVVAVTSEACHDCRNAKPRLGTIPAGNPRVRVVFADIGVTKAGGINGNAPVISRYQIKEIPAKFVFDESGALIAKGQEADAMIKPWIRAED